MAIRSEQEAFDLVLQEKIPKNLPKQATKRKVKKPMGSARIDPQSGEYKQIFLENKEAEEKKEEAKKANLKKKEEREILNASLSDDQAIGYIAGCISKKVYIFYGGSLSWIFYFSFSVRFGHYTALRLDGSSEPRRTIRSNGDGGV